MDVDGLRLLVRDCLARHLYESAVFYSEKLVSVSSAARREAGRPGAPVSPASAPLQDAYLYCQALFFCKRYRAALAVLTASGPTGRLTERDSRFLQLAALSAAALEQWEEVVDLLGGVSIAGHVELERLLFPNAKRRAGAASSGASLRDASAACLLRGRAFAHLGSLRQAAVWYAHALRADPRCAEAWEALHASRQLRAVEEAALVRSLEFGPGFAWLRSLYLSQCLEPDQADGHIASLEAALPVVGRRSASEPPSAEAPGPEGEGRISSSQCASSPTRASELASAGCGLRFSADVVAVRAGRLLELGRSFEAHRLASEHVRADPRQRKLALVFLAAAVAQGKRSELFDLGHALIRDDPEDALGWHASGCYYASCRRWDEARRHFGRATRLDGSLAPSLIAYAHSFGACGESDAAMAVYRTAERLFPNLHEAPLGIGREHARMAHPDLAAAALERAAALAPWSAAVANERGALAYASGDHRAAAAAFRHAAALALRGESPSALARRGEADLLHVVLSNLGHALRRAGELEDAAAALELALDLRPGAADTVAALAYVSQLAGRTDDAVDCYYRALALAPDLEFASEMLSVLLEEEVRHSTLVDRAPFSTSTLEIDAGA